MVVVANANVAPLAVVSVLVHSYVALQTVSILNWAHLRRPSSSSPIVYSLGMFDSSATPGFDTAISRYDKSWAATKMKLMILMKMFSKAALTNPMR